MPKINRGQDKQGSKVKAHPMVTVESKEAYHVCPETNFSLLRSVEDLEAEVLALGVAHD